MKLLLNIEALLLASNEALSCKQIQKYLPDYNNDEILLAIQQLQNIYEQRAMRLIMVEKKFKFFLCPQDPEIIANFLQEKPKKLSKAALETLAVIAYKQPITRAEIEQYRGVSLNPNTIKVLLEEYELIKVVGKKEVPGMPELLGTTNKFLEYFALESIESLPETNNL